MYRSALPLLLLSGLILWLLLRGDSDETASETSPPPELQQSDSSSEPEAPNTDAANLDRTTEEQAPADGLAVKPKSSTVKILWRDQAPLSGYLLDADDRQWFFNRERGGSTAFDLKVPPGSYTVHLQNGGSAWPQRFRIMDDPTSSAAFLVRRVISLCWKMTPPLPKPPFLAKATGKKDGCNSASPMTAATSILYDPRPCIT